MDNIANEGSTEASAAHSIDTWKHVLTAFSHHSVAIKVDDVLRTDAIGHYGLDAQIHFQRLEDDLIEARVDTRSLIGAHGWESPATLLFVIKTIATRLASACGFDWYRVQVPDEELRAGATQAIYIQMLPTASPGCVSDTKIQGNWSDVLPVVPAQPALSRDLLKPGFCW